VLPQTFGDSLLIVRTGLIALSNVANSTDIGTRPTQHA